MLLLFPGVMLNSHSPPSSTPLEPCRVVPYMNVPALRGISLTSGSVALSNFERLSTAPFSQQGTAFSAISPAFISAAHQVIHNLYLYRQNCLKFIVISNLDLERSSKE